MSIIRESRVQALIQLESVDKTSTLSTLFDELAITEESDIGGEYYVSNVNMHWLGNSEYSCMLKLKGSWKIIDNLSLGDMEFFVKSVKGTVTFTFTTEFKLNSTMVKIKAEKKGKSWILASNFNAQSLEFTLAETYTKVFYKPNSIINIKTLICNFSEEIADTLPNNLDVKLQSFLLIHKKKTATAKASFLISMKIATDVKLSEIEFLKEALPSGSKLELSDFSLLYSSEKLDSEALKKFNKDLPTKSQISMPSSSDENVEDGIEKGLTLGAMLKVGDESVPLSYAFSATARKSVAKSSTSKVKKTVILEVLKKDEKPKEPVPPSEKGVIWKELNLKLGPIKITRLGLSFKESKLFILINVSVDLGGVKFMLIGLGAGSKLTAFNPQFTFSGLALEIKTPTLEVSGLLYKVVVKDKGKDKVTYSGAGLIKTPTMALSAIVSYQKEPYASLLIYARADFTPIGPVFFLVDGLTLGMGINRDLILPKMDKMAEFPLVSFAMTKSPPSMEEALKTLDRAKDSLPPIVGKHFICFGIKFSSFKIIDSFALVTLSFGQEVEVNLLGMSKLEMPPSIGSGNNITPIALVKMGFMASYLPEKGELSVRAKILPGSYIFSKDCILTGGFAFSSWFTGSHEGDFVLTLGGYHPKFIVPKHYPKVEPVALNWQISDALRVKGSIYFALCAHAIMAGARLEATYEAGSFRAWFFAEINLLLAWKPFYYQADLRIEVGGSYTMSVCIKWIGCARKTLSVSVGARLDIWGPDFAGKAIVDLGPVSLKIAFGDSSSKKIEPISWDEFEKTFLPSEEKDICKIVVKNGMIRSIEVSTEEPAVMLVNPGNFLLSIDGLVPNNSIIINEHKTLNSTKNKFGIAPMNIKESEIVTTQKIEIWLNTEKLDNTVINDLGISESKKNMPTALWGASNESKENAKRFIEGALNGIEIQPPKGKSGTEVSYEPSGEESTQKPNAFTWNDFKSPSISSSDTWDSLNVSVIEENAKRKALSKAFGLGEVDFSSNKTLSDWYVATPNTVTYN